MTIKYRIQIPIEQQTEYGVYRDAIYMDSTEFNKLTASQREIVIGGMIAQKVADWKEFMKNPPTPTDDQPTDETQP